MCEAAYERLPFCLEAVQMAYMQDTVERRGEALKVCEVYPEVVRGRSYENVDARVSLIIITIFIPFFSSRSFSS